MENKEKKPSIQKEYVNSLQNSYDFKKLHIPYSEEMSFYDLVRQGDIEHLKEMNPQLLVDGQGVLSDSKERNAKYHFIIATAFITRFCIEGGLQKEEAYTLSDVFIRKMDKIDDDIEEIKELHHEMVFTFAEKMRDLRKTSASSIYIRSAIDYINNHLNEQIHLKTLAEYLGISEKYLSALFKKETGMTIVSYIEERQMESACQMLCYSDLTFAEISDSLAYCSQSYFSKIFKKHYGMTPMQYRMKNSNKKFLN